ncbi:MAG: CAP domain-containing protein [Solirubrobacteraceae bacterium]
MQRPHVMLACMLSIGALGLAVAPPSDARASVSDQMIVKVNEVRAAHGLRALRPSPSLSRSSGRFSRFLMARDMFGHRARVSSGAPFRRLGEVLAMHSGRRAKIRLTIRQWLASPGHRAIVLSPIMRYVGAGKTTGRFRGHRATIWVLQAGK